MLKQAKKDALKINRKVKKENDKNYIPKHLKQEEGSM